ncbi:hypothetical protein [Phocaeicola dorei]|uniref:hypothetical protein n=1 Tax=Phocaeicola dorei TaxID=357276 RepID=UPI0032EE6E63
MAIKALKQSVSISETQKMIHQWKGRGINDPTITKLLDLYLGMPAYMNSQGIYPLCNFYDIRLSLRFSYTSTLVAAVTNCRSFGMIWDEPHAKVIAFYSPLWYRQENGNPTESPQNPAQETPQDSAFNSNILYIRRRIPLRDIPPETEYETRRKQIPGRLLRKFLRKRLTAEKLHRPHLPPQTSSTGSTPLPKTRSKYWSPLSTT